MATVPGRRPVSDPVRTSRSWTLARSAPEPMTPWAEVFWSIRSPPDPVGTRTEPRSRPTAVETPGVAAARAVASEARPAGAETMWSAVTASRSWCAITRSSLVCMKTSVEEKAMASTIGVIAEASRREFVRELAAASEPDAPATRSGRPMTAAQIRAISGPRRPTAIMKNMTTPSAAFAASSPLVEAATPAKSPPPMRAAMPSGVRIQPYGGVPPRTGRAPDQA